MFSAKIAIVLILALIIVQFVLVWILHNITDKNIVVQWIVYYFPVTRSLDFVIGYLAGYIYLSRAEIREKFKVSTHCSKIIIMVLQLIAFACTLIVMYLCVSEKITYGFQYAACWTFFSVVVVYSVATQHGWFNKLLTFKPLVFVGNISQYIFLIHFVILRYCWEFAPISNKYVIGIVTIIISIVLSLLWEKLFKKETDKRGRIFYGQ